MKDFLNQKCHKKLIINKLHKASHIFYVMRHFYTNSALKSMIMKFAMCCQQLSVHLSPMFYLVTDILICWNFCHETPKYML